MGSTVSLIICTYNRAPSLKNTLDSLSRLIYPDYEVIVVDNNSTDNTREITAAHNVRYCLEQEQGLSHARNRGIQESRGDYLAFLDDDVTITSSDWIQAMLSGFNLDCHVGIVGCRVVARMVGEANPAIADRFLPANGQDFGAEAFILGRGAYVIGASIMFSRKAIGSFLFNTALGRKGTTLLGREELEFVDQLAGEGYLTAYVGRAIVDHHIPASRFTYRQVFRHNFYEGVSIYLERNIGIWMLARRIHKLIMDSLGVMLSLALLNQRLFVARFAKLARTMGIMWGPVFKTRN